MSTPERLHALFYEYVDGMLEKRAPHREAHLAAIAAGKEDGTIVLAGALGDPPYGGLLVFRGPVTAAERFAADDPYVHAGLVTSRRIEPWTVV